MEKEEGKVEVKSGGGRKEVVVMMKEKGEKKKKTNDGEKKPHQRFNENPRRRWGGTWGFAKGDAICTSRLLLFTPSNFFELFEIFKPLHLLSYHHLGTIFPLPFNLIMFLLGPKMCKTISYDWKMLLIWIA